jgi:hypothetical protein
MTFTIDLKVCHKYGLKVSRVLALLAIYQCSKVKTSLDQVLHELLEQCKIGQKENGSYFLYENTLETLGNILTESETIVPEPDELIPIAQQLREIFPKGKKDGTNSQWRESTSLIVKRLQKFIKIFGEEYKDYNKILAAAKEYVDSFNGNYAYMRTLKYFILKDEIKFNDEGQRYVDRTSDLATRMDNLGEANTQNFEIGEVVV